MHLTDTLTLAVEASKIPERARPSTYPSLLATRFSGRTKHPLGDFFGLRNFGVNLTVLQAGATSSFCHAHQLQDEFIFVLSGRPTLVSGQASQELKPGMCVGFRAGTGQAHCLLNQTAEDAVILEVGDRTAGDVVSYTDVDLRAEFLNGAWCFTRRDGSPLPT